MYLRTSHIRLGPKPNCSPDVIVDRSGREILPHGPVPVCRNTIDAGDLESRLIEGPQAASK